MPRKPKQQTEIETIMDEVLSVADNSKTEETTIPFDDTPTAPTQEQETEPLRYTYLFRDEITKESVQGLIDVLSQHQSVDLWFCTNGGEMTSMNALIYYINSHPDICLFLNNYIASAGTLLLVDCNKPVIITEDLDWILFHKIDMAVMEQVRKTTISNTIMLKQMEEMNKKLLRKIKPFLTKKQIKEFEDGGDVVLYRKSFPKLKSDNVMLIEEILSEDYESID